MSDKYSTIQQHQPLRVPSKWGHEERSLIVQLEEILDDLYRRFNRLRIEDLGKKLVAEIKDKYGKVNGIYVTEDGIDIIAESGESRHINLQSDGSQVLIDPGQIKMSTPGLIKLLGSGQSKIEFIDGTEEQTVVFRVNTDGVEAQTFSGSQINADSIKVKTIEADEIVSSHSIPNIVVSTEEPEPGNNTIWLEPVTEPITPVVYSEERIIAAAAEGSCPERVRNTFTYSVSLSSPMDCTDATYIKLSGHMNRKGNDYGQNYTVSAKIRFSDGTFKSLGDIGSGRSRGNCDLLKEITLSQRIAKTAVGVVYTVSVADNYGYLCSFSANTLKFSGQHQSQPTSDDTVTVHYVP